MDNTFIATESSYIFFNSDCCIHFSFSVNILKFYE